MSFFSSRHEFSSSCLVRVVLIMEFGCDAVQCSWCGRTGSSKYSSDRMGYAMCCDGEYSCVLYQVKHLQLSILQFRMRQLQTIFTGRGNRYWFCLEMWRGVAQFLVLEDWEETLTKHYDATKENYHIFDYHPLQDNWIRMCWIQNLKKMMAIRNCQKLTAKYAKLLSHLPQIGFDVYACIDLDAIEALAAWMLVKLLELHRGEVVQI